MWIVLTLNLAAAILKFILSVVSGSTVLRGDAYYTGIDALVDLMLLIFVRVSGKPPDTRHPYGHAKFEALAVATVAVLIFAMLQDLGRHVWEAWSRQSPPHYDPLYVWALAATLLGSSVLAVYEIRAARRLNSASLRADGWFTVGGCVLTALSILSLLAARSGLAWPDSVGALLACVMIIWAGWQVARDALASLTDEARLAEADVRRVVLSVPGAKDCHQIRSRGTPDQVHVDLHVQVDPQMTTIRSHALAHQVEREIMSSFPEVVEVAVHIEPLQDNQIVADAPQPSHLKEKD
jgi:cation diffusion facilitator family transporter